MLRLAQIIGFSLAVILLIGITVNACAPYLPDTEIGGCDSTVNYLTSLPVVHPVDYQGVIPQGDLDPSNGVVFPSDHIYFSPISVNPGATPKTFSPFNVVSPGDGMKLFGVNTRHYQAYGIDEYELFMKPCNEKRVYLEHVSTLSPALTTALTASNSNWQGGHHENCITYADSWGNYDECASVFSGVTLAAQDAIGTAGAYKPLGFGIYDQAASVAYLTPLYYTQSLILASQAIGFTLNLRFYEFVMPSFPDITHSTCVLNSYASVGSANFPAVSFKDHAGNALSTWDGTHCGTYVEDSKSAGGSGNWFDKITLNGVLESDGVDSTLIEWAGLALVHDNVNLNTSMVRGYPVFSFGTDIPITGGALPFLDSGRYDFTVNAVGTTNRDFDSLIVGTEYCYSGVTRRDGATTFAGVVRLKMSDQNTLLFQAFGAGGATCGTTALNGAAITFVR